MKRLVKIISENKNYVPDGEYTGIFNQAYVYNARKKKKSGEDQEILALEFLVTVNPDDGTRRVKKSYYLPSNRIEADLRRFLGDDFASVLEGDSLDIVSINQFKGTCADLVVRNYHESIYPVPLSRVEEFHPCDPGCDEIIVEEVYD